MSRHPAPARRCDGGYTLPEVLITVMLLGLIATVLGAAITITFRQTDATEGRLNVARAEQSIDTWLPADLASTDVTALVEPVGAEGSKYDPVTGDLIFEPWASHPGVLPVNTSPGATPCGNCSGTDLSGANALQLAWFTAASDGTPILTQVQYQYIQVGDEWILQRIECVGGSPCTLATVLHDLAPPDGSFDPDTDRPRWILDTPDLDDPQDLQLAGNAQRIQVTINGGGAMEEAGGGLNTINLTAGGVQTGDIEADDFNVPAFVRAKSRCGGPVTLIVDDSGSIGTAVSSVVEPGVLAFIESFRGTPTQVQVIQFSNEATAIGPGSGWHRYVDMTDDAAVDQLKTAVVNQLDSDGGTNWEEAFFHALKESDGTTADQLPNRIVFFTDGIPTRNRTSGTANRNPNNPWPIHYNDGEYRRASGWPDDNGTDFNQESWDRADVILDAHRGIDLIFVGVGPDLNANISWIHNPAVYDDHTRPPSPSQTKKAYETISGLLTNLAYNEVLADFDPGSPPAVPPSYTNPEVADFYLQSSFDTAAFGAAMRAAALKDCGGTLTVQTRRTDDTPVNQEFVYENRQYRDDAGQIVSDVPRVVTTSANFKTGTFDFDIPASTDFFSVDIVPQELQTLTGFTFEGWSCRAGGNAKSLTSIGITDSDFEGFTVDVAANEAVSCILTVS